jgi:PilZ domain
MSKEKRVFSRIKLLSETRICFKNKSYPVQLKNISLEGATVISNSRIDLSKGNSCILRINAKGSKDIMDLEAQTMYCSENHIGFQFSENSPCNVQKLQSLIVSNFGNIDN